MKANGVRVELDDSDDRISNKIRKHQTSKVKTQIVVGDEEVQNNTASVRFYGEEESKAYSKEELLELYK
jgi:threonyl-tRNA synthetase